MYQPVTGSADGGDLLDGGPDAEVGPAPAEVPAHRFVDVGVAGLGILVEQRHGLHDLAGLAVPALGHVVVDPGLLDRMERAVLGQAVDGRHVASGHAAHLGDAGASGHAVDVAGAGAAEAHAAAVLEALDVEPVTQDPEEFLVVVGVDRDRVSVEVEGDHRHRNQAPYSLSGKFRTCLPVARAQALAAAPEAAGTPSSPIPPGVTLEAGRMWTLISGAESNMRVHLQSWKFDSRVAPLSTWSPPRNTRAKPSWAWPRRLDLVPSGFTQKPLSTAMVHRFMRGSLPRTSISIR